MFSKSDNTRKNKSKMIRNADHIIAISENTKKDILQFYPDISPDKISVMAEIAEWPDEIDANRAREAEMRAERRLQAHDPAIDTSRAEVALKKAIVRLQLAERR